MKSSSLAALCFLTAAGYYYLKQRKTTNTMSTTSNTPRGYRNNNPLNIRYSSANNWKGKVTPNTDGSFEQFTSMAYGYRAALFLIRKKINSGENTVTKLINVWAPTAENDTRAYINSVCSTTGMLPATVLDADNKEQLCKLAYAMAIHENGTSILPDMSSIYAGWELL